jgi:methyltransferase (TIGR00027 family)
MIEGQPSRTAERVAIRRAAHQLLDRPPVHADPLAIAILGPSQAEAMRVAPRHTESSPISPFLRAFLAVRSRVAEETLASCVEAGVRQYVVLGAGLDTFAYRNPHAGLRVFEVDHLETQAWKLQRLREVQIAIPEDVTFAAVDFAVDALAPTLRETGWRDDEPTFFSWLGVTPYLTCVAMFETLSAIAPFTTGGGGVVFDYSVPPQSLPPMQKAVYKALAERVAAAGEPFRSSFEPATLVAKMQAFGFQVVQDITPDELNATYFADRTDGLRVGGAGHILKAFG